MSNCKYLNSDVGSIFYKGAYIPAETICQIISEAIQHRTPLDTELVQLLDQSEYLPTVPPDAHSGNTYKFYVSSTGDDSASGSFYHPFSTLEKARDAVRELSNRADFPGATIYLRGGVHYRDSAFELTNLDNGSSVAPIVYRSYLQEEAIISGGKIINNFIPLQADNPVYSRFAEAARPHIYQANLGELGITDYGTLSNNSAGMQVVFEDEPMTLARWPKATQTADVIPGYVDITGGVGGTYTPTGKLYTGTNVLTCNFTDRVAAWTDKSDIWMHGYWSNDYGDHRSKLQSVDSVAGSVTMVSNTVYIGGFRVRLAYYGGGKFYYENVLEELTAAGEWYMDRNTGILYFWPPNTITDSNVRVSVLDSTIITLTDTCYNSFHGLNFRDGRTNAFTITNGNHNNITNCKIYNMGQDAVYILNSSDNRIANCELYYLGGLYAYGSIVVKGGHGAAKVPGHNQSTPYWNPDYLSLTSCNNIIENNIIHDVSLWRETYAPPIYIKGVGVTVKNNLIYNANSMAILAFGNDHLIEYNEIHDVAKNTADVGAIYISTSNAGEDTFPYYGYSFRGTVIRYNYIHDLIPNSGASYPGLMGVYMDDISSGNTVFGNIIDNVPYGIMANGGRNNYIENNIVINSSSYGLYMAQSEFWSFPNSYPGRSGYNGTNNTYHLRYNLLDVDYQNAPYNKYDNLASMWDDSPQHCKYCYAKTNIILTQNMGTGTGTPIVLVHMLGGSPDESDWPVASAQTSAIQAYVSQYSLSGPEFLSTTINVEKNYQKSTTRSQNNTSGVPGFVVSSPENLEDFELREDSQMWSKGWVRIPIELIGYNP